MDTKDGMGRFPGAEPDEGSGAQPSDILKLSFGFTAKKR